MKMTSVRLVRAAFMTAAASVAAVILAAVFLAFAVPALAAMFPSFAPTLSPIDSQAFGRLLSALRFTLTEAMLSALVAVAIGLPSAFLVARRRFAGRRFLLSLSGVPLCVPPVIIALAFVLFYGRQGYLNTALMSAFGLSEPPVTFLYSLAGVVIAHGFYNFPVVLRTVSQVWDRLPEAEEESARLLGAGRVRLFRTVILPRLAGPILASAVLVFLYCFFSFIIVLLFGGIGGTTLEVELFRAARSSLDFKMAGVISMMETGAALGIVFLYVYLQKRLSAGTAGLQAGRTRLPVRGTFEVAAVIAYLSFILVFFLGPLVSIVVRSFMSSGGGLYTGSLRFGLDAWVAFFRRSAVVAALGNTVLVGASVALLSTSAALCFALMRTRSERRVSYAHRASRALGTSPALSAPRSSGIPGSDLFFRMLPLTPLAVSSIMLGFGWTMLVPRGNVAVLILAQSALSWPFAWTQIQTALDRIPSGIQDAAAMLSPDRRDVSFRVLIPLALPGILSGAGFVFAISAGDASLPLVLSLRGFENLSLMLFRLAGSYRFSEACVSAVVLTALCGVVFFLQDVGMRPAREKGPNHE